MVEHFHFFEKETKSRLDYLLEKGFFRMGQAVFTSHFGIFDKKIYRYIWLRNDLDKYEETSTVVKLKKRNKHFQVKCNKAIIDDEREYLYKKYKNSISFDTHTSIKNMLLGYPIHPHDCFDTYELCIYDNDKMVACSYFDIGTKAAEGIASFYDTDYEKYSLGKYAIYMQIEACISLGMQYFYPGYFIPGYPPLDYKLNLSKNSLSFYQPENDIWLPIQSFCDGGIPINIFKHYTCFL